MKSCLIFFRRWWWILVLFFACILLLWPLLRPGFFITDDGDWMIIRLTAFFQSFREGQFPVRFLGRLNYSYGYPVSTFLYPGFLYLGSMIHLLGISFVNTIKIIIAVSTIIIGFATFGWLRSYFSRRASIIGAFSIIVGPYLAFDIYTRGSVGEILALACCMCCLFAIAKGWRLLFALSLGFLLISHNSIALLSTIFIIGYIVVAKQWKQILPLCFGIGLATFFWFPAWYERRYVIFDSISVSNPENYFLTEVTIPLAGLASILAFGIMVGKEIKKKSLLDLYILLTFLTTVFFATPISSMFWRSPILIHLLQFPFRFLSVSLFTGAWCIAWVVEHINGKKNTILYGIIFILMLLPLPAIWQKIQPIEHPEGYYTTNEATTTIANEYMPRWVKDFPKERAAQRLWFISGNGIIIPHKISTQTIDATLEVKEKSTLQINTIYYPGWGILIDGVAQHIEYSNPSGVMRVIVLEGNHHILVQFRETIPRFISSVISGFSAIGLFLYIFWPRQKKQMKKRK